MIYTNQELEKALNNLGFYCTEAGDIGTKDTHVIFSNSKFKIRPVFKRRGLKQRQIQSTARALANAGVIKTPSIFYKAIKNINKEEKRAVEIKINNDININLSNQEIQEHSFNSESIDNLCIPWTGKIHKVNNNLIPVKYERKPGSKFGNYKNVLVDIAKESGLSAGPGRKVINTCSTQFCINPNHLKVISSKPRGPHTPRKLQEPQGPAIYNEKDLALAAAIKASSSLYRMYKDVYSPDAIAKQFNMTIKGIRRFARKNLMVPDNILLECGFINEE